MNYELAKKLAAGGLSCMIVSGSLHPVDTVKVRIQNQITPPGQQPRYNGMYGTAKLVIQEEGFFRGLMKGISASLLREATYSSMRLGFYDIFKTMIAPEAKTKADFTLIQKISAGVLSGGLGSLLTTPTDLVKIRFQGSCPQKPNPYKHTMDAFYQIYKHEGGLKGLYRGVGPTVVRAAFLTSSQLASYDHMKRHLLSEGWGDVFFTHLVSATFSGFVTTIDYLRTRVMMDKGKYSGPIDCLFKSVAREGPLVLWRGVVPNFYRLGPHFIFSLPLLEFLRYEFGVDTI